MDNIIPWIGIFAILIVFIVIFIIASRSFSKRAKLKKEFYAKAQRQRDNMLKYRDADERTLAAAPAAELIEGLAAGVQDELADCAAPNAAFLELPLWRRYAYAAYYFFSDTKIKLSGFFRNSADPLLSTAMECLEKTGMTEYLSLIRSAYEMLDDNNDAVSVDEAKIAAWDAEYAKLDSAPLTESVKNVILCAK
ncbi:MAG: hypothetical protein IJK23_00265, partial [Clostridia bacterium]|nr:hypothetical protein [Clostridia bacterium]